MEDVFTAYLGGSWPVDSLQSVIHEAMHHWCFDSPLGTALSAIWLRSRFAAEKVISRGSDATSIDDTFDILDDVIRYETTEALLRPIAEGMALFAEFDLSPGHGATATRPTALMWELTRAVYADSSESVDRAYTRFIARLRCGEASLRRKASLLSSPFDATGGGYLPGYLFLKTYWRVLCVTVSERFADPELFMNFVHRQFFFDKGLIGLLSDKTVRDWNIASKIGHQIQVCMNAPLAMTDEDVAQFERDIVRDNGRVQITEAYSQLNGILSDLGFSGGGVEYIGGRDDARRILAKRHMFCIGRADVYVRVVDDGRVLFFRYPVGHDKATWRPGSGLSLDSSFMGSFPSTSNVPRAEGHGAIEQYVSTRLRAWVMVVVLNDTVVSVLHRPERGEEFAEEISAYRYDATQVLRDISTGRQDIETVLADSSAASLRDMVAKETSSNVSLLYRTRGLPVNSFDEDDLCAAEDLMLRSGFVSLFRGDEAAVVLLAISSVMASNGVRGDAADFLRGFGLTREGSEERLRALIRSNKLDIGLRDDILRVTGV